MCFVIVLGFEPFNSRHGLYKLSYTAPVYLTLLKIAI